MDADLFADQLLDLAVRLGDLGEVGLAFDAEVEAAPPAHGDRVGHVGHPVGKAEIRVHGLNPSSPSG